MAEARSPLRRFRPSMAGLPWKPHATTPIAADSADERFVATLVCRRVRVDAPRVHPDDVRTDGDRRLPASARAVFAAVVHGGPLTHEEIRRATGLPARTVRFALHRLVEGSFVQSRSSLIDRRIRYFFVHERLADDRRGGGAAQGPAAETEASVDPQAWGKP